MTQKFETASSRHIFPLKVLACFFGLLFGLIVLTPSASMQSDAMAVNNNANVRVNGNVQPPVPKSTIRGRIIYADTGSPVRRAGLMLLPTKGSSIEREKSGLTNELGEFEIKNVSEGRYIISVNLPGVVTPFSTLSSFEKLQPIENSPELADLIGDFQEVVTNGSTDVDVTIAARRGAAITGRISYADGEAAIGVRVEILRKKEGKYAVVIPSLSDMFGAIYGGAAGSSKTDDRGVYRIAGLPAGEYTVRVAENVSHKGKSNGRGDEMLMLTGFSSTSMVSTYYPNTSDITKAETVKLGIGQESPEVNIVISNRTLHSISGTAIDKTTRQPIKGARINLKSDDEVRSTFSMMREFDSTDQADEQGRWSFKQLPPGKYTVIVQPPVSYESAEENVSQKAKTPKFAQTQKQIVIEEKDLAEIVVELGYGATVSGTINFENQQILPSSISLTATDENEKFSESVVLYRQYTKDGKPVQAKTMDFKITGIPNGKIYLRVDSSSFDEDGGGGGSEKQDFYVKKILFDGRDVTNAALEAKEGEELKGVQIVLSNDLGKLKGKVTKADKTPAAGAKISLISTDKLKWSGLNASIFASTNSDGEFEASAAPGEYYVVFQKNETPPAEDESPKSAAEKRRARYEKAVANAQRVTIKAKESETLNLILPE